MDFGDFKSGCSVSNFFSVAHVRENRFSQDTQHRSRRSPHKKLRATRTSASLVIDQLKNGFRRPGDFTPRMRTRRNWRPEFLIKYLRDNRHNCSEERAVLVKQQREKKFVPEMPNICSIGLHSSMRSLSNSNDLSSRVYGTTKSFDRPFDIVLRPIFMSKYWIEKSTPASRSSLMSTDVSLKTQKSHQIAVINCTEWANISKHDRIQKNNQSYEHIKEKSSDRSDSSRGDYAAGDRPFISNDFKDSSVKKECRSCVTRDAQIQTSSRKSSRRKKVKKRSKLSDEGISRCKRCDNELRERIVADFRVDSYNSKRRNCYEKSRLCVQVLDGKRTDYINKFTAVNRQIEEITATLRETCYNDSRNNLENCEEYFSSVSDDTKVNTTRESDDVKGKSTIARGRNKTRKKVKRNVKRIIRESENDRRKNMLELLHTVDNINDELLKSSHSKDIIAPSMNPAVKLNDIFVRRSSSADKRVYPLNKTFENKRRRKCHFAKQISLDLDLTKDDEIAIEADTLDEVHVKNNFVASNHHDKHVKDLIEYFNDLESSRYHKKTILGEKVGEMAILEDIKKRIDRDFDDRSVEKDENDTDDFLTVSQKSSSFDRLVYEMTPMKDAAPVRAIEEPSSTSLIVSGSPDFDLTETQVRDSISADAMSEYSNKNSTLSEYFSCMRFPSVVSFAENEDELALSFENRSTTAHNSLLNCNCGCSCSNLNNSLNNFTCSNGFDCSYSNSEYISPNKYPIETRNATIDTFELSEDRENFAEDKICERKSKRKEKEFEKRYTADSTLETSKSSRYIGSIDSGVFSSSLIDFPHENDENSIDKSERRKKCRVEKTLDGSSPLIVDLNSDSSCTDDNLDRRVNDIVRDLTEKLILCERRMKLKKTRKSRQTVSRTCKLSRSLCDAYCDLFNSPRRSSENERLVSISTPTLLSLSDSEIEH